MARFMAAPRPCSVPCGQQITRNPATGEYIKEGTQKRRTVSVWCGVLGGEMLAMFSILPTTLHVYGAIAPPSRTSYTSGFCIATDQCPLAVAASPHPNIVSETLMI